MSEQKPEQDREPPPRSAELAAFFAQLSELARARQIVGFIGAIFHANGLVSIQMAGEETILVRLGALDIAKAFLQGEIMKTAQRSGAPGAIVLADIPPQGSA